MNEGNWQRKASCPPEHWNQPCSWSLENEGGLVCSRKSDRMFMSFSDWTVYIPYSLLTQYSSGMKIIRLRAQEHKGGFNAWEGKIRFHHATVL